MVEARRTPAEVSHRFAAAINAGDVEGALACWSPAAVIAAPDGSEVRGHRALTERFRELIAVGAQLQISVSDAVHTELGAIATTRMTVTMSKGRPAHTATTAVLMPGEKPITCLSGLLRIAGR